MTTEFFPEQTIRYRTYAKRTLVEGLNGVFSRHPDTLLQGTKASIEYPKTEVDYPAIVLRLFERELFNAGVGHQEIVAFTGESDSIEVPAVVTTGTGSVQLHWPPILNASGYKLYKGTAPDHENQSFTLTDNSFTDIGQQGFPETVPTVVTASLNPPQPSVTIGPPGNLPSGTYYYRVTATTPSEAVKFGHYYYTADAEFAVYALSAYDRDLIADTLVQTIATGRLAAYTATFFDRVYPLTDLFPDSDLHFININSDHIQGFGESQTQTPWGAEDDLIYMTSYRVGLFGEIYSLPPKITYGHVLKITQYPYIGGLEPVPTGNPDDPTPWVSNQVY